MPDTIKESIVVVGFGWVGQANALSLVRMGYEVFYYDVVEPKHHYSDAYYEAYEKIKPLKNLLDVDSPNTWYIVCIGDRVSPEGHQDIGLIERALQSLLPAQGKVILRSTILPHYLGTLRFDLYVPEFLHEVKAVEECLNPFYFVLGRRADSVAMPSFLQAWEQRAYKIFHGTPEEASHLKYLSNIWNAVRIAFVNEFGDSITDPVDEAARKKIESLLDFILERRSYLRYGKTYGGHCLPKDMRAYIAHKTANQKFVPLLIGAQTANAAHEAAAEKYDLPQWFSSWEDRAREATVASSLLRWWNVVNSNSYVKHLRRHLQPVRRLVEQLVPDRTLQDSKNSWNAWADKNPFYYSLPDSKSGRNIDEFEIRETGAADYAHLIATDPLLQSLLATAKEKTAIEIGSGVGRMTEFFARDFGRVEAVDISKVMLNVARKRLATFGNITLSENRGNDLPCPDASADFVFSYLVLRHLPSAVLIRDYLREIKRVLKPDGIAKIQLRTGPDVYRWRWFHGVSINPEEAKELARQFGFEVLQIEAENTKSLWLVIKKPN